MDRQEYARQYYQAHRAETLERTGRYAKEHREEHNAKNRRWRALHPEAVREIELRSRAKHRGERNERERRWAADHPEQARESNRREVLRKYKLTPEQYDALYAEQEGKCAICGKHLEVLHVDHDHATGKVRGLLCLQCNAVLGHSHEDAEILLSAVEYLDAWKDK